LARLSISVLINAIDAASSSTISVLIMSFIFQVKRNGKDHAGPGRGALLVYQVLYFIIILFLFFLVQQTQAVERDIDTGGLVPPALVTVDLGGFLPAYAVVFHRTEEQL